MVNKQFFTYLAPEASESTAEATNADDDGTAMMPMMTANVDNDTVVDATKGNEWYTFQHNWNHTMLMDHVAAEWSFRSTFLANHSFCLLA